MTGSPQTIERSASLASAHALMRKHGIRHLPVVERGKLVGMLSMRDLHLLETLKDVDPEQVRVDEAMSERPYVVAPSAPLQEVVQQMLDRRYGSAIVADGQRALGVFTTVDALRVLSELLAERKDGSSVMTPHSPRRSTRTTRSQRGSVKTRAASSVPRAGRAARR